MINVHIVNELLMPARIFAPTVTLGPQSIIELATAPTKPTNSKHENEDTNTIRRFYCSCDYGRAF
jgi:hypothetical protein